MSHITKLAVKITDADALAQACRELGVELRREQKTFRTYAGSQSPCDMAICDPQNERAYEIGLVATRDAAGRHTGWEVHLDHWAGGGGLYQKLGDQAGRLLQHYGIAAAERKASADGWRSRREQLPDGSIRLICEPKPVFAQQSAGGSWGGGF